MKPGTAPGTTRVHKKVNVVLQKFEDEQRAEEELVRLASENWKPQVHASYLTI